jgi:toxin YoeB
VSWKVLFTKQAQKDARKLASASPAFKVKAQELLPFEALVGDLRGSRSRRINIQHRLVYQVLDQERIVKVLRMGSHYD